MNTASLHASQPRILILVALPHFSYDNPHSAVAGYMNFLGAALAAAGYEVIWSHPKGHSREQARAPKPGGGGAGWTRQIKTWARKLWPWAYHSLLNWRYFRQQEALFASLAQQQVDHILEFLVYGSDLGLRLKAATGATLSVVYDAPLNTQFFEMHGTYSAYRRRVEKREQGSVSGADHLLMYSTPVQDYLAQKTTLPAITRILPCLLWKPVPARVLAPDKQYIGFIGSFLRWHQVEILVEAFADLADEFPALHLDLIGFGEEWHRIRSQVEALSCRKRIYMPGFVEEAELLAIKGRMTIGVMPGSNWYGSPLKLFEYAQAGIPMIAPSSPTVLDVFQGTEAAVFIDPQSPRQSLVRQLRHLLNDTAARRQLGQRGQQMMQTQFSPETYSQAFLAAIQIHQGTPINEYPSA